MMKQESRFQKELEIIMDENCHVDRINKEAEIASNEALETINLRVMGMGCVNCSNRVHNTLISHHGVIRAEVSHVLGEAEIAYLPSHISMQELIALVADAGDGKHRYMALPL
jgi:copper chaperone CopZ